MVVLTSSVYCHSPELLRVIFTGLLISLVSFVFFCFQLLVVIHILSCPWIKVSPLHPPLLLSNWETVSVQWIFVNWQIGKWTWRKYDPHKNHKSKVAASTEVSPASV